MKTKPFVGQRVYLNDEGMEMVCGLKSREEIRQASDMTITYVASESLTFPEDTFAIEVDQPLINVYLLDHNMVDPL